MIDLGPPVVRGELAGVEIDQRIAGRHAVPRRRMHRAHMALYRADDLGDAARRRWPLSAMVELKARGCTVTVASAPGYAGFDRPDGIERSGGAEQISGRT